MCLLSGIRKREPQPQRPDYGLLISGSLYLFLYKKAGVGGGTGDPLLSRFLSPTTTSSLEHEVGQEGSGHEGQEDGQEELDKVTDDQEDESQGTRTPFHGDRESDWTRRVTRVSRNTGSCPSSRPRVGDQESTWSRNVVKISCRKTVSRRKPGDL